MKKTATRKAQIAWISEIIANLPADLLNSSNDPFETVAANVRALHHRGTIHDAALHFLQGCGLHGFPIWTSEHVAQLIAWGYSEKSANRNSLRFFDVSAGLLIDALRLHGCTL